MELTPTTPLDPLERRAERYLAMVLLALVATPSSSAKAEGGSGRAPTDRGTAASQSAAQVRHVRPPRSC